MSILEIILIGISLSVDAFSLALGIGAYIQRKKRLDYSVVTGMCHFIMPILGFVARKIINNYVYIGEKILFNLIIVFIIFGILLDKDSKELKVINPFLFGITVSIDSLLIGMSIDKEMLIKSSIIFSIVSFIYTYMGFKFSSAIIDNFSGYSKVISIAILIAVLIKNIM